MEYRGIAVSRGVAIAPVYLYRPWTPQVEEALIELADAESALADYYAARQEAEAELEAICSRMEAEGEADKAKIFAAHREILFDDGLCEEVEDAIRDELYHPAYAVESVYTAAALMLSKSRTS